MENSKINSYQNEECMICLEPLNNEIAEVSCSHLFHYKCIKEWLSNNDRCPLCNEDQTKLKNRFNF